MRTQKIILLLIAVFFMSCGNNKSAYRTANLSGIDFDVKIERFDKDLWAIKGRNYNVELPELDKKYPEFAPIYFMGIFYMGSSMEEVCSELPKFFADTMAMNLYSDVLNKFKDMSGIEKNLTDAFRRAKYFFPQMAVPKCFTHISGFNQSVVVGDGFVSLSLDNYMGENYRFYKSGEIYNYLKQNMIPEKISSDYIYAWLSAEFELMPVKNKLLDEMIYKGKLLYFTKLLLPDEKDNLIIGYTAEQQQWCIDNEKEMWGSLIEQKHLFSNESVWRMKYLEEAPFTQPFSQDSPGRAGCFIGWRIVENYMQNNPRTTPLELMQNIDSQQILEKSGYNP
jgi:gliding motility-associated lipoprotein GldB